MFSIGLTGGIGSGKTTVADMFAARGVPVIDTDLIAHQITAPGGIAMPLIESTFGPEYVAADGSLDRAKMRTRVFSDQHRQSSTRIDHASADPRRKRASTQCSTRGLSHRRGAVAD